MAFRLSKADIQRRDGYVKTLGEASAKLETAVNEFNNAIEVAKGPIESALGAYNDALAEAKGFAEDIASNAETEIDDKSDNWRDGERGQAASEWKDAWENAELEEVEIDFPEELQVPDLEHASNLEGLPEDADSA